MADSSIPEDVDMKENASTIPEGQEENEDWDKTRDGTNPGATEPSDKDAEDGQYKSFGRSSGRGLAQLMSPHAERGKELVMTEEEEQRLAAELGKWASRVHLRGSYSDRQRQINTDTNPYEGQEDSYFKAQE